MATTAHLRLATLGDLAQIASGTVSGSAQHQLPPPGGRLDPWPAESPSDLGVSVPYIRGTVSGQLEDLPAGRLYWLTIAEYAAAAVTGDSSGLVADIVQRAAQFLPAGSAGTSYPIVYKVGDGNVMRWLQSTFRGNLYTTEEFQFKVDWGKPGADPDYTEADQLAFATELAAALATGIGTHYSPWTPDVVFTEVGVVQKTQTDATAKDGTGGNLAQANGTQWYMYPVGSQPMGATGTATLPFEVSCAVSTQTAHRGPSGKGRFYLPPFAVSMLAQHGMFEPTLLPNAVHLITDIFTSVKAGARNLVPVVVSRRKIILNEITSVNVGAVPDSQRRRRRSQDEARASVWTAA